MEESFDYRDRPHDWLVKIVSGDIPSSPRHIAARYELERRKGRNARITSWVSIGIALVALGVAAFREFDSRSETGHYYFFYHDDIVFRCDTKTGEAVGTTAKDGQWKTRSIPFNQ